MPIVFVKITNGICVAVLAAVLCHCFDHRVLGPCVVLRPWIQGSQQEPWIQRARHRARATDEDDKLSAESEGGASGTFASAAATCEYQLVCGQILKLLILIISVPFAGANISERPKKETNFNV